MAVWRTHGDCADSLCLKTCRVLTVRATLLIYGGGLDRSNAICPESVTFRNTFEIVLIGGARGGGGHVPGDESGSAGSRCKGR